MFQVTQAAAERLARTRQSRGLPETTGVRLYGEHRGAGEVALGLAFTELPAEDDLVSEQQGTIVFIAPEVAEPLSSVALDVQETPEGPRLVLTPAAPDEPL